MKGNQNLPNEQVTSNKKMLNHYHSPIAHEAIVEKIETLHDIQALIGLHILNSNNIMETVTLIHHAVQAHHTLEHKI